MMEDITKDPTSKTGKFDRDELTSEPRSAREEPSLILYQKSQPNLQQVCIASLLKAPTPLSAKIIIIVNKQTAYKVHGL